MLITYKYYLLSKTKILTEFVFDTISKQLNDGNYQFISEIDRWDWEIESLIEGFSLLSEGVVLVKNSERRVSVKASNTELSTYLKNLINSWNNIIELSSILYSTMSEELKNNISEVEIDFELYTKEYLT